MTTETVLSEKDVFNIVDDAIGNPDMESPEDLDSFKVLVRKAEFAVLQSPEVQAWKIELEEYKQALRCIALTATAPGHEKSGPLLASAINVADAALAVWEKHP